MSVNKGHITIMSETLCQVAASPKYAGSYGTLAQALREVCVCWNSDLQESCYR